MVSIDLGSNTFRCIAYDCENKRFGKAFERIVKTADALHQSGRISEQALERVLHAIEDADQLYDFKTANVKAVTTAAMRMAENSDEVLQQFKERSGIAFEIIDADKEAEFTLKAVRYRMNALGIKNDSFVLLDIGGGSTEVIFSHNGRMQSKSFPVGIVTVAQQCETPDEVRQMLKELLIPVGNYVQTYYRETGKPQTFVTTAGTPTTMAAFLQGMTYDTYDVSKINGYRLTLTECQTALEELLALDDQNRAVFVGVGKETLIVAGVVIVQMFYELLGFDKSIVVDDGVREGVAIDYCG